MDANFTKAISDTNGLLLNELVYYGASLSFNKSVNLNKNFKKYYIYSTKLTRKINDQFYINVGSNYKTSPLNEIIEYGFYNISPQIINKETTNFYLEINLFKKDQLKLESPKYFLNDNGPLLITSKNNSVIFKNEFKK